VKPQNTKSRLVLLDSHAIIHRAYHALPEFSSSDGTPTGALYGLSSMLLNIMGELKPDYVVACYDREEKTFRHEAYGAYKGTRKKTEDALIAQLISSREVFEAFGIPMYDYAGFEADDMLGTIVEQMKDNDEVEIVIASGDMDTLQLVKGKKVQVFTLKKGINDTILYDEDAVVARFSFPPKYLPDYKGIRGDPSDNIIGIKGIGEKGATELIKRFGTIEEMYKVLKSKPEEFKKIGITERVFNLIKDSEEEAMFSKSLATIRLDAPIKFILPEKTLLETTDKEKVKALFIKLEFKSMTPRFEKVFGKMSEGEEAPIADDEFKKLKIAVSLLNSDLLNPTLDDIRYFQNADSMEEAKKKIYEAIEKSNLSYVFNEIELPLIPILEEATRKGILVDVAHFKKLSNEFHKKLGVLEKRIYSLAGHEFNINSPKQLQVVLFDELGIGSGVKLKKTAGGARTTNIDTLLKFKDEHEIIGNIIEQRELQKLVTTYIDSLPLLVKEDGRIHATWNQLGASTGRFSSHDPNLQNIPIKGDYGVLIRDGFIAERGHTLLSFDYSQIELRITAILSEDTFMKNVFHAGQDIHAGVASRVFGVPENEVTPEMRRRAKVINFGIIYGMGVTALQATLGSTREEATLFYKNYFEQFPTIANYLESVKKRASETGFTETLFGRRRMFASLRSKIPFIRAQAERMAINAPIQGTAADCVKIAIRKVDEALKKEGIQDKVHLMLQVHDELVFEVKNEVIGVAKEIIKKAMEGVLDEKLGEDERVPLSVSIGEGQTWGSLKG
jgi:DNA polymerase-1